MWLPVNMRYGVPVTDPQAAPAGPRLASASQAHAAPPIDDAGTELDLIHELARRLRRAAVDTSPWGLAPHQARALEAVARRERRQTAAMASTAAQSSVSATGGDGLRVSELASRLQIAPRSATEVADALEAAGLLIREPDPTDRRAVLLRTTERGREVAAAIRAVRQRHGADLLRDLGPAERAQLRALLERLLVTTAMPPG